MARSAINTWLRAYETEGIEGLKTGKPPGATPRPTPAQNEELTLRLDPLAAVWATIIVPLLVADTKRILEATAVIKVLEEKHPGQRSLRTCSPVFGPGSASSFAHTLMTVSNAASE